MTVVAPDQLLCGQWDKYFTPEFTFSNNAWGKDDSGGSCLNVTQNATTISTTWKWTNTTSLTSVHAFPNLLLNTLQQSPLPISNLTSLTAHVDWHMGPSTMYSSSTFEADALREVNATANVAFDMFLDPQRARAGDTGMAGWEVMVWLASVGPSYPIGYFDTPTTTASSSTTSSRPTCKMGGVDFELFTGTNPHNQTVHTFVATHNTTHFTGDLASGIYYLSDHNLLPRDTYLGVVQFGTETFFADEYVTFTATGVGFDVVRNDTGTRGGVEKSAAGSARLGGRRKGAVVMGLLVVVALVL
ncbi:hypothetical protein IFR05_015090 [Cadophora sp. M221]|nr:hypothetical protein IFR05_015090 [Cadophora sp. M221]